MPSVSSADDKPSLAERGAKPGAEGHLGTTDNDNLGNTVKQVFAISVEVPVSTVLTFAYRFTLPLLLFASE